MRIDFAICRCVRTEYGKRIRKLYESHQISEKKRQYDYAAPVSGSGIR